MGIIGPASDSPSLCHRAAQGPQTLWCDDSKVIPWEIENLHRDPVATIGSTGSYFVRFFLGSYDTVGPEGRCWGQDCTLIVNGFSFSAG